MKSFLLIFLMFLGACTLPVHTIDKRYNYTLIAGDTIFISLSYIEHYHFDEEQQSEWLYVDDTTILFNRFLLQLNATISAAFPYNPIVFDNHESCLPWKNLFSRLRPLDTIQLEGCIINNPQKAKRRALVHLVFERAFINASSTGYGSMSASRFAIYIPYIALVKSGQLVYFQSFRNTGSIFNDTKFSTKREEKMTRLIVSEIQKLYNGGASSN